MNRFFTLLLAASCLNAVGQSEYCLDGTVWDDELQGCVSINSADINNDGCVQLNDLLDLLTAYGDCGAEESAWQCGDAIEYQGYDYETVQIGQQCWFAENLRNENYQNGDAIPSELSASEWSSTNSGAVTLYGEGINECAWNSPATDACDELWSLMEYGRLYNWHAVGDARGLCPNGWHVPSDEEWMILEMSLGMTEIAASNAGYRGDDQALQMKTTYGWSNGGNGSNTSGFSALPAGSRYIEGYFSGAGNGSGWWSSSLSGELGWYRVINYLNDNIYRSFENRRKGFSVRCVQDFE